MRTRLARNLAASLFFILHFSFFISLTACSGGYSFTGASIPPGAKTISIATFPNYAATVNPQLSQKLTDELMQMFSSQTPLDVMSTEGGDLQLEGEITGYDITPMSISDDAIAAETRLTITINVRYSNKANSDKDFERSFSAFQNFSNTQTLTQVQEQLCQTIVDEIVETIFNQTVADW
jgi:hypothetical protein